MIPKENQAPKASTTATSRAAASNVSKVVATNPTTKGVHNNNSDATINTARYEEEIESLKQTIEEQDAVTSDLRLEVEVVQKERDFYFEKLRDIEVLLQQVEDEGRGDAITASILKILYATTDGFEPVVNQPSNESEDLAVEPFQRKEEEEDDDPFSEQKAEAFDHNDNDLEPTLLEQETF